MVEEIVAEEIPKKKKKKSENIEENHNA